MHTGKLCYSKLNYRVSNTPPKPNMHAGWVEAKLGKSEVQQ
jgi:hypothetical protein